jgi:hypothetical protein
MWPKTDDAEEQGIAVVNALNNLLGYPHGKSEAWSRYVASAPSEVAAVLAKWTGDCDFDLSNKGYFNRLK